MTNLERKLVNVKTKLCLNLNSEDEENNCVIHFFWQDLGKSRSEALVIVSQKIGLNLIIVLLINSLLTIKSYKFILFELTGLQDEFQLLTFRCVCVCIDKCIWPVKHQDCTLIKIKRRISPPPPSLPGRCCNGHTSFTSENFRQK